MSNDHADAFRLFIAEHGYLSWLGLHLEHADRGRVRMSVPGREELYNPGPGRSIHGGIAATLIDTASGFAPRTTFEELATARLTTTDLDVSYLRPATGDLTVEAEVLRAGGRTGVTDVSVESSEADEPVAVGRTTYRLFRES